MASKSGVTEQVLSLPRGGGALRGIGEKFSADLHTGVGHFSIPLSLLPGRNGFQPTLELSYSSGGGNGPFGQGWSISVPGVARRVTKGVPRYDDLDDVFVLAGFEDLVRVRADGASRYYRPRVESSFARVRHVRDATNNHWEVRTRDGLTSLYGSPLDPAHPSCLRDPRDSARVLAWKLTETRDPFGNRIAYGYERDTVAIDGAHEWDQSYLTSVRYLDVDRGAGLEFLASVVLEYEDRPDPFSDYAAGFEVRTTRRCKTIRVFSHVDRLREVRRYELSYIDALPGRLGESAANGVSLLGRVRIFGVDDEATPKTQELPPIELRYGDFDVSRRIRHALTGTPPASSLSDPSLDLADLEARGMPDFIEVTAAGIRSWRNLGRGRFAAPKTMAAAPSASLADKGVQLFDSDGDGRIELVVSGQRPDVGYYPLSTDGRWIATSRRAPGGQPIFDFEDPEVRLLDLDRNGATDVLRTGAQHLEHYFHDEASGWTQTFVARQTNLDDFPNVNFSDPRVKLADMSGDGLQDIVLVQGRLVSYWPNLGQGRWGRRVDMGALADLPMGHDPARLLFADLDGDGAADAVYVENGKISVWLNQSGNRWGSPIEITGMPALATADVVRVVDLHGTGTAGILWSRDVFGPNRYTFLALTGLPEDLVPEAVALPPGPWTKPYVLRAIENGRGAITRVEYLPSTVFRLRDDAVAALRWRTPLPFPVQVVARVVTQERFNGTTQTSRYLYHHGCWDGAEREFAGFGRVDHVDAEVVVGATDTPPTETRTWFHQGAITDGHSNASAVDYSAELWSGDGAGVPAEPGVGALLLAGGTGSARRQILRALRGRPLREEVYGLDETPLAPLPYRITDYSYGVARVVESPGGAPSLSFTPPPTADITVLFAFSSGQRLADWERGQEPMVRYTFQLQHDAYGQATRSVDVGLPRRAGDPYLVKAEVSTFARRDDAQVFIVDRPATKAVYALSSAGAPSIGSLVAKAVALDPAVAIPLSATAHFYDGPAFVGLDLGAVGDLGALVRTETLAFTAHDLGAIYGAAPSLIATATPPADYPAAYVPSTAGSSARPGLVARGLGYGEAVAGSGLAPGYYFAEERREYDFHAGPSSKGLVRTTRDPLGGDTRLEYDARIHRPTRVTDAAGLEASAKYDERSLEVESTIDLNGATTTYRYTPLGHLKAVCVASADGLHGDDYQHPSIEYEYGFAPVAASGPAQPQYVHTKHRVDHVRTAGGSGDFVELREYSDGLGRLVQTRTLAEDDIWGDPDFGDCGMDATGAGDLQRTSQRTVADPVNVVVSGWTVLDGQGKARAKYEPTFGRGWQYDDQSSPAAQKGVRVELAYDARYRLVRATAPDGTFTQVVYGRPRTLKTPEDFDPNPWDVYTYDPNDNSQRADGGIALPAWVVSHVDTPSSVERDAWGREIRAVTRKGASPGDELVTEWQHDLLGSLIEIVDPERRVAFRFQYDRALHKLRSTSLDGGASAAILDAQGNDVERRDDKGALAVRSYDSLHRPDLVWARDAQGEAVTLRERRVYGEQLANRPAALAACSLGRLVSQYDEAGLLRVLAYDFRGRILEKARRTIAIGEILGVFSSPGLPAAYRVDWTPRPGQTFDTRAAAVLEPGAGHESSFRHDALDRFVTRTYPRDQSGKRRVAEVRYNRGGELEQVHFDGTAHVDKVGYTAHGRRSFLAYSNGLMARYRYDRRTFRLTRLHTARASAVPSGYKPSAAPLQDAEYEYDCAGNITAITERTSKCGVKGAASLRRAFSYDALYRLTSAKGRKSSMPGPMWTPDPRDANPAKTTAYTEKYAYDAGGNMRTLKGASSTRTMALASGFDASGSVVQSNRLSTVTVGSGVNAISTTYGYDAAGNLTQETESRRFAWDHADRMRSFEDRVGATPTRFTQYLYDAAGERVMKVTRKQGGDHSVTVYVEGVFESYHEVSGVAVNAAHTMSHVLDGIGRVVSIRTGTARAGDKSPAVRHELADHLGSVALAVDGAGKAYQKEEFTPYGETSFGSSIGKRHRFTGKERDDESGLSYHSARYYMPWAGRWASSDPLGPSDGVNPYAYTWGRPLVFIDPSGMYNKPSNMCLERPPPEPSRLVTLGLPDPSVEMQPTISAAPSRQIITSLPDRETPQEKFQRDLEFGAYLTQNPAAAMRYSLGKTVYGEGEEQSRVAATRTGEIAELLSTPGVKLVRPALFKSKTPVPVPRTGPKGVDPDHHNANVIVRDINGAVVTHTRLVSGNMTAAEKALGFPKGPLASHTEARGTRQIPLEPGQTMTITGIQEPCTSCRGYMNRAAKQFGVVIRYQWREGGKTMQWFAAPGPPPRR